jgi:hypothetical protein
MALGDIEEHSCSATDVEESPTIGQVFCQFPQSPSVPNRP